LSLFEPLPYTRANQAALYAGIAQGALKSSSTHLNTCALIKLRLDLSERHRPIGFDDGHQHTTMVSLNLVTAPPGY